MSIIWDTSRALALLFDELDGDTPWLREASSVLDDWVNATMIIRHKSESDEPTYRTTTIYGNNYVMVDLHTNRGESGFYYSPIEKQTPLIENAKEAHVGAFLMATGTKPHNGWQDRYNRVQEQFIENTGLEDER